MKNKKTDKEADVKTKSFQIKARKASALELGKLKGETLFINPGEQIHKVVILELGNGDVTKVLSKIRDKDSLIYILVRNKRPTGQETAMKADKWVAEKDYDKFIAILKKDDGVREILNSSSEEMYKDLVCATDFVKTEKTAGTASKD
ncbi:MAG: hypothetical protein ABIG61_09005 [Planctomycetota bacterium]